MIGFYVSSITGLKWGNKVPGASANDFLKQELNHSYCLVTFGKPLRATILEESIG